MMIKKFTAPTLKEAMAQTKKELGPDSIILKTGKVKTGGLLDFNGKEAVEILAAVDNGQKPLNTSVNVKRKIQQNPVTIPKEIRSKRIAPVNDKQLITIQTDLDDMKRSIYQMSSFMKYKNVPSLPENLQFIMKQLLDNEVDENIARSLVEDIHNDLTSEQFKDLRFILSDLLNRIQSMIKVSNGVSTTRSQPKIVLLVGPTGVGKTTTVAKLATNQKLINNKKVALISTDTFRIGAVDQLKTFGNIAEIPLSVVYTPKDMVNALKNYEDMDVIYIDTTGRSQRDRKRLEDMRKLVINAKPDETHLVLSVTTKFSNMLDAVDRYSLLRFNRILLTKTDETTNLGVVLNLASQTPKPISYITTGQNVPEDIERATVKKLARMIVRRKSN
ncbi:flagellar biosynthesis protein FlhF [candidate division KSB1 bacterium]